MAKQGLEHELIRAYVGTAWTPDRSHEVMLGVQRKRQRARKKARFATVVGLVALVAGALWSRAEWLGRGSLEALVSPADLQQNELRLADGAVISATAAGVNVRDLVRYVRVSTSDTYVQLAAAGVSVATHGPRAFHLQVREIAVEVLAATFVVTQVQGQMTVDVQEGEARVQHPRGRATVKAGEEFVVPLDTGIWVPTITAPAPSPRTPPAAGRWQTLARRGRFDEAFVALQDALITEGRRAVPDEPGALLLAADAARLSHHPEQAVPHLQRFVAQFTRDPRASMAAFTLGLVLLEELGRPREAAEAFARSRAFAPQGDLAEDALARRAEAWFRAGDSEQAQHAAKDYLMRFPQGRRVRSVKRFGAIP